MPAVAICATKLFRPVTVTLEPGGRALDEATTAPWYIWFQRCRFAAVKRHLVDQPVILLTQSNTSGRDLNDAQLKFNDVESRNPTPYRRSYLCRPRRER